MKCEEVRELLQAYIDSELDAANNLAVEQHLRQCPRCARMYGNDQVLHTTIKESSLSFQAPASLRARVRAALPATTPARRSTPRVSWPWLSAAALLLLLLGGFGFWAIAQLRSNPAEDSQMAQAVVDSHERSLADDHLVDILSDNPNTLKSWFESRLGFSPPVINLTLQGYSLVGGRLDFLDNRAVAAIVYKRDNHVINLFVCPTTQNAGTRTFSLQGYYLTHWTRYGMDCWAVADLDEDQLQQFARLINQHSETFL